MRKTEGIISQSIDLKRYYGDTFSQGGPEYKNM